jgi:hypothetical protein
MKRPSEQRVIVDSRYDGYDVGDEIRGLFIVHYAPKFTYDFPIYDILGLSMRAQISYYLQQLSIAQLHHNSPMLLQQSN